MEGIVGNFIINLNNTDSLDGDSDSASDSDSDSGSDIDDMKSFMSNFISR
jgi:hypothetical protein